MGTEDANAVLECMAIDMAEAMSGLTETMPLMDVVRQRLDAIKVAQSALRPVSREHIKKLRGEWKLMRRMAASAEYQCSECQLKTIFTYQLDNFCSRCGAPMTEEAVQMVMERLEALHDGG